MKILNKLERIDQSAHECWSDIDVRQVMAVLPTLIRVARAAEGLEKAMEEESGQAIMTAYLLKTLQQLRNLDAAETVPKQGEER